MSRNLSIAVLAVILVPSARADFELQMLQKFAEQNQDAAARLRRDAADLLARAQSSQSEPDKLIQPLRGMLTRLHDDSSLPQAERQAFIRQAELRLRELKEATKRQEASASEASAAPVAPVAPQAQFGQAFGQAAGTTAIQLTPIVAPNRRFVRIGINGIFTVPNLNVPLVPIQAFVPTRLYGPGRNITVGPPGKIFQMAVPFRSFTSVGLNTTVTVPAGGTAVVGGFGFAASSRSEVGVPVLGRLPYAGRLFRNVGVGQTIFASNPSVSVRVISLEDYERALFGE